MVDCGPPPTPENGQVEFNRTLNGAESNYSCNRGFILEGVSIRTCLSSGNWSGDIPMCISEFGWVTIEITRCRLKYQWHIHFDLL